MRAVATAASTPTVDLEDVVLLAEIGLRPVLHQKIF
jgi:hypothetical protein